MNTIGRKPTFIMGACGTKNYVQGTDDLTIRTRVSKLEREVMVLQSTNHELRQPLMGLLLECEETTNSKIKNLALSVHRIASSALDIRKIWEGTYTVREELFDIVGETKMVVDMFESRSSVPIVLESFMENVHSTTEVRGDALLLNCMLRNYISNAVKYTRTGSININMTQYRSIMTFTITDTGCGIYTSDADDIGNSDEGSHGLGMVFCSKILTLLGSKIMISSNGRNHGTTVMFAVPIVKEPDSLHHSDHISNMAIDLILVASRLTIGVIDDDKISQKFIRYQLNKLKVNNVLTTSNYEDMVDYLAELDILFVDLHLGNNVNGIEIARKVRLLRPSVHICLLTGDELFVDIHNVFDSQMMKPCKIKLLTELLMTIQ
jgi:CheY-like chemotaxis protein